MRMTQARHQDACEVEFVDEAKVRAVRRGMKADGVVRRLAETFSAMGDATRVKIILVLSLSELCVCDLAALMNMTSPAVSHHLRILRTLRLVRSRRRGKMVYYALDDDHIEQLFRMGLEHVEERSHRDT